MELITHRGGWEATVGDLASVAVPEPTDSYVPVPYQRFVEEVKLQIPRFGLRIESERFALAREGNQMFGVLSCRNGHTDDWCLAIGLRSSYDRSLAVGLVAGSHVFVCDNLAFHGESEVSRKHTINVFRDLPDLIYRMLHGVAALKSLIEKDIRRMKQSPVSEAAANHLMVLAIRSNALPASRLPKLLEMWDRASDRTAWDLYNAFTGIQKSRSPREQIESTLRLTKVFREAL